MAAAEGHHDDLREANQHLVLATLAAERLEDASRETRRQQDEFLAMLAHELRNPLAPVRSAVALLDRLDAADPRLKAIGAVIGRQVDYMARLLDDLLDVSRITHGRVTLRRRPTSVRDFIEQAVEINRALIAAQRQQLRVDFPGTPIYVDGDPTRLAQIFGNLLHNATKYTQAEGVISVTVRSVGPTVTLTVADNGVGISSDALPHVFDLFIQEDRSLSRSQGGLGIGLTIVRTMVELHGGTVEVRSSGLGQGSVFTVVLPRVDFVPEPPVQAVNVDAFVPARILVVDDKVDAADMLQMLLKISGYEVEIALDGATAIDVFARQKPHIVLCDIGLPGMNGYEIAQYVRRAHIDGALRPILIALTGYDAPADRERAVTAGFDYHCAKPIDFEKLLKTIKKVMAAD